MRQTGKTGVLPGELLPFMVDFLRFSVGCHDGNRGVGDDQRQYDQRGKGRLHPAQKSALCAGNGTVERKERERQTDGKDDVNDRAEQDIDVPEQDLQTAAGGVLGGEDGFPQERDVRVFQDVEP